jgi:hypothetical protein
MRVKMQYSVDLEEIPAETRPLLSRANHEIRDAGDHMDDVFALIDAGTDYANIVDSIEEARKNLAEADFRLGDAQAILTGYLQAKHAPPQQPEMSQAMESIKEKLDSMPSEEPDDDR